MDHNIYIIEKTAIAIIDQDFDNARKLLSEIDTKKLAEERSKALSNVRNSVSQYIKPSGTFFRSPVKNIDKINTFERDKYTCRYCQRLTINPLILREISRVLPDIFPYHLHWKFEDTHLLYWIYASSIEHKVSFPNGGNSDEDNLITSCYLCNDIKKHYPFELLKWQLRTPSTSDWDGFTKYLPQLKKIKATVADVKIMSDKNLLPAQAKGSIDLNFLPVGTIAKNIKTNNYYIVLERKGNEVRYFSQSENMILKIKSKVLLVTIEFQPNKTYSSVHEAIKENYNKKHLEILSQALYKLGAYG